MNSLPQQGVTETQPMNSPSQQGHGHCQAVRATAIIQRDKKIRAACMY